MIELYAEGSIDLQEMKRFLSRNSYVSVSQIGTNEGPGDSVVLPLVEWKKLRRSRKSDG
jgi:hypothetical protein